MLHRERRENRLWNFDYDSNGCYFITICTKDRKNYFGEIVDKKMNLSEIGLNAEKCWKEIPNHFREIQLKDFVIMPNHMHGIIKIENIKFVGDLNNLIIGNLKDSFVGDGHARPLRYNPNDITCFLRSGNQKRQHQTIPVIMGSFKSAVSKIGHMTDKKFAWQRSYFDEFITNMKMYKNIVCYIKHNVDNWEDDEFNKE